MYNHHSIRRILEVYILPETGTPYLWGGTGTRDENPTGYDCSGLVIKYLQKLGVMYEKIDLTADGILNWLPSQHWEIFNGNIAKRLLKAQIVPTGSLLFYYWNKQHIVDDVRIYLNHNATISAVHGNHEMTKDATNLTSLRRSKNAIVALQPVLIPTKDEFAIAIPPAYLTQRLRME